MLKIRYAHEVGRLGVARPQVPPRLFGRGLVTLPLREGLLDSGLDYAVVSGVKDTIGPCIVFSGLSETYENGRETLRRNVPIRETTGRDARLLPQVMGT